MTTVRIAPVRTPADYQKAKARVSELIPQIDAASLDELDILSTLVEQYERKHFALEMPTPLGAIRFRMEQAGLKPRDLAPFIGSRSRVSEVLSGKRPLSLDMIRALNRNLGIAAEVLIGGAAPEEAARVELPSAAAIQQLQSLGSMQRGEDFPSFLNRAFGADQASAHWRKSRTERTSAKTDHAALTGWLAAICILASGVQVKQVKRPSPEVLGRRIAKLSLRPDGPQLAKAELARVGIILITLEHLPGTYLDGAALCRSDGIPIIALTLRHDRIDNFWFTLLHELAHVLKHLGKDTRLIIDDLDIKGSDDIEAEADIFAQNALIPPDVWAPNVSPDLDYEDIERIAGLAGVHPAIAAGRWQREHGDYRRFARSLGRGQVRHHFK